MFYKKDVIFILDTLKLDISNAIVYLKEQKIRFLNKGNITLVDRGNNLIVSEPGDPDVVPEPANILVTDLSGNVIEGQGLPIQNFTTHLEIYRSFPNIGSVVHSHGMYTTAWAQSGRDIPVYGTSHFDYFQDAVPCTRAITPSEVEEDYGSAAGNCIVEIFEKKALNPDVTPGVLLFQHGAYVWGETAMEAANRAVALEQLAMLAYLTEKINPDIKDLKRNIFPASL